MCERHKAQVFTEVAGELPELAAIGSVVYYIGNPTTQHVKIGTSTNLRARIAKMRHQWPGVLVLATEPGSYPLEAVRHKQFAALGVAGVGRGRREWFRREPILVRHVSEIRQKHGIIAPGRSLGDSYVAPWTPPRPRIPLAS